LARDRHLQDDCEVATSCELEKGRQAFDREDWAAAYACLKAADAEEPLSPEHLDRLATAAYLIGEDLASVEARTRAHSAFLDRGDAISAAASALWLAFIMMERPAQRAQAAGWIARARRLITEANQPCVEEGWLLCASARQLVLDGDFASASRAFARAAEMGAQFRSPDLTALARHGEGRTLLALNRPGEGFTLLDEVMVAVTGGELAPIVSGAIYCSVISACHGLFDLRRAQEWTLAFQHWCASHPDVVVFRGQCLIRRSELMQLHGAWPDALDEARRACERFAISDGHPEAGAAHYRLAELSRLRGDFNAAEEGYRLASQAGRNPNPGLALLRLAQGQTEAADTAIRLALRQVRDPGSRVHLLAAAVEIMLATGDLSAARAASDDLTDAAGHLDAPFLHAVASQASGALALAEGQAEAALDSLRLACSSWQELDAPYELAQVRVLVGLAYRQLRDHDGAQLEFDAALEVFERLGARTDAGRVASLVAPVEVTAAGGLTGREVEVLRLIATGATNRSIATRLCISEKTVARHVSNIFTKLDLSSRAAATAYAYEHKLV
jgi:DNA-binding CsgD family transcriptional regulator